MVAFLIRTIVMLVQSLRLLIGGGLICLGILGVVLPILPGMPFLILGILAIGRRSRVLRQGSISGKLLLKRWARHPHPSLASLGRWSLAAQRKTSRQLRRLLWWWQLQQNRLRGRIILNH